MMDLATPHEPMTCRVPLVRNRWPSMLVNKQVIAKHVEQDRPSSLVRTVSVVERQSGR